MKKYIIGILLIGVHGIWSAEKKQMSVFDRLRALHDVAVSVPGASKAQPDRTIGALREYIKNINNRSIIEKEVKRYRLDGLNISELNSVWIPCMLGFVQDPKNKDVVTGYLINNSLEDVMKQIVLSVHQNLSSKKK